ncbi:TerB family tellurite resistance protein [Pedobacter helvus]|uniref:TerB family tellurite resistance protein n=1 Tax=Pedobacter helvus TaxID=2563444 RepID=A0ABW9JM53_9SPHI|nr:TerB family tellurite resistance protein [Pedobacter ureilyticus]
MEFRIKLKKVLLTIFLLALLNVVTMAQSQEAQQLLLNVEKLSQMKNILSDMKKGYQVISGGYNAIKDISQGNFSLHEVFLDGLMLVSPEVKKYRRVADIISYQKSIVSEYKSAFKRFSTADVFSVEETRYLGRVYKQLFDQSVDNLDELLMVITSSKLRMSDSERLAAIDRIFLNVEDKLVFLRDFNNKATSLSLAREKQKSELKQVGGLYQ